MEFLSYTGTEKKKVSSRNGTSAQFVRSIYATSNGCLMEPLEWKTTPKGTWKSRCILWREPNCNSSPKMQSHLVQLMASWRRNDLIFLFQKTGKVDRKHFLFLLLFLNVTILSRNQEFWTNPEFIATAKSVRPPEACEKEQQQQTANTKKKLMTKKNAGETVRELYSLSTDTENQYRSVLIISNLFCRFIHRKLSFQFRIHNF